LVLLQICNLRADAKSSRAQTPLLDILEISDLVGLEGSSEA